MQIVLEYIENDIFRIPQILQGLSNHGHHDIVERAVTALVLNLAEMATASLSQFSQTENLHFQHLKS